MNRVSTVLVSAAVVAGGLFVYDRWLLERPPAPMSQGALDLLESQMKALAARKASKGDPRMERVTELIAKMGVALSPRQHERVLATIARCFTDRERVLKDPALPSWSDKEFERRYRAAIEPHINEVRVVVGDLEVANAIVARFIYDGRPIRKPEPPAPAPKGPVRVEKK